MYRGRPTLEGLLEFESHRFKAYSQKFEKTYGNEPSPT
jgi:hypothetical protein